jgi:hypothetical protein
VKRSNSENQAYIDDLKKDLEAKKLALKKAKAEFNRRVREAEAKK